MKQSVKMWALQTEGGAFLWDPYRNCPATFASRENARYERRMYSPTSKVVRVQVDITVVE